MSLFSSVFQTSMLVGRVAATVKCMFRVNKSTRVFWICSKFSSKDTRIIWIDVALVFLLLILRVTSTGSDGITDFKQLFGIWNRFYGDNGHHGRLHDVFVLAIYMFSNMQSQCFYYFFSKNRSIVNKCQHIDH